MRVVKGNDATLTHSFYGSDDETLTDATGSLTVTVAREDATSLTGGTVASNNGTTGEYDFSLTASSHTDELDELKVTWTGTVDSLTISEDDYVKVVGARFFRLAELRAMRGIASTSDHTNDELKVARDIAEDFVENFTEHAWVPRYKREVFDGNDGDEVFLSQISTRRLISVKVGGTAQTLTDWTISSSGRVRTDGDRFTSSYPAEQNVEVQYEWGELAPPQDLKIATLKIARHVLLTAETAIPDRARMMQSEWGMFVLDTATEDKPTGLPEVDSVLQRYRKEQPGWVVG